MRNRIWAVLIWLKADLVWSIPAAMLMGLAYGALVNSAKRPKAREGVTSA